MAFAKILTEGGQIWIHRIRMIRQVIKTALFTSFLIGILLFSFKLIQVPSVYFYSTWYYIQSSMLDEIEINPTTWEKISHVRYQKPISFKSIQIKNATKPYYDKLILISLQIVLNTLKYACMIFCLIIAYFFFRGYLWQRKRHISGNKIISPIFLKLKLLLTNKASKLNIGKLPLLKNSETKHFLITGGTGSGKTVCLFHFLDQIRTNKQKTVIVDTTGTFIKKYYREDKDIILNPTDSKSLKWHPWIECEDSFDFESIAESFIPLNHSDQDNYWKIAGRSLLSSLLIKLKISNTLSDLKRWVLYEPLPNLCSFLEGTKAMASIDMNSEKTAASVRSVAASYLGFLELLKDTQDPFSIKKWVQNSDDDSWLFLSCDPRQRAAMVPLISCWYSIAIRSLLDLEPNLDRRIWYIIDELPTLNKLQGLETLLTEGRKYGGCAVIALQAPSQLETIYGKSITKTIVSNCATRIVFADYDPESSNSISRSFGEREILEFNEGLSYGAHEVRDGVTLSANKKVIPLVSSSDIMTLKPNEAFIKLPGNIPITKIRLKII
ncbi:DNA transport protein TraD [Candidatus Rubidus massiliensis]|nr:DNA transport protein TraD [Candidatus Rubidus massiliensis]